MINFLISNYFHVVTESVADINFPFTCALHNSVKHHYSNNLSTAKANKMLRHKKKPRWHPKVFPNKFLFHFQCGPNENVSLTVHSRGGFFFSFLMNKKCLPRVFMDVKQLLKILFSMCGEKCGEVVKIVLWM